MDGIAETSGTCRVLGENLPISSGMSLKPLITEIIFICTTTIFKRYESQFEG
jgi:hypothetical protein